MIRAINLILPRWLIAVPERESDLGLGGELPLPNVHRVSSSFLGNVDG
jgi:hypothetical protein